MPDSKGCYFEKCGEPIRAKGLCSKHYYKMNRYGDPGAGRSWGTCMRGLHDLSDPENVYFYRGKRQCLPCMHASRRAYKLQYNFHMSEQDWEDLFDAQGRGCAICHAKETKSWHVDHDHTCCPGVRTCGKCVRGILCHPCNRRMEAVDEWTEQQMIFALEYKHHRPILLT